MGIQPILDGIINFLPNPMFRGSIEGREDKEIKVGEENPFSALVFKTISDPYTGRISIMRVFSGRINPDSTVYNSNKESNEKMGGLFYLQGKEQVPAGQAQAGDLVATAKLKSTSTGDTLCDKKADIVFNRIKFPEPFRKEFNYGKQENADTSKLKKDEWHCFDLPFTMVCGSMDLAQKVYDKLKPQQSDIKTPLRISIQEAN